MGFIIAGLFVVGNNEKMFALCTFVLFEMQDTYLQIGAVEEVVVYLGDVTLTRMSSTAQTFIQTLLSQMPDNGFRVSRVSHYA